jgi:small subunit ribosomal protein S8
MVNNLISNIKNAQMSKKSVIFCVRNKFCEQLLNLFWDKGLIIGYKLTYKNKLKIYLKYKKQKPSINFIKLLSKPSQKIYYSVLQLSKINFDNCLLIFSTNKGLKTLLECKKQNSGGKLILILN